MATADPIPDITGPSAHAGNGLLVLLAAMTPEQSENVLANLTASFPGEGLLVASPDALPQDSYPTFRFVAAPAANISWTLTAADFVNAHHLAEANGAKAVLMLSSGSGSISSSALRNLGNAVLSSLADLAVPRYDLPPHAGLVNSAILYPLTRALFASPVRFPLAVDLGLSLRMAERLTGAAVRFTASSQGETPLWPVNEATVAGFTIGQFDVGARPLTQPSGPDLNTILPLVTGALFSDIDAKAAFWQRFRQLPPARDPISMPPVPGSDATAEIDSMIQAFRLAYSNLQEIWSLILPPNSLLGLKRLSAIDGAAFRMSDNLWARIVYDFLLAWRLRTINRGHLLGALIPLYLAWVASHFNITAQTASTETHIEAVADAFDAEKTYLVSRWRWPDRFNP
jgi:glucosylglycerate synthase